MIFQLIFKKLFVKHYLVSLVTIWTVLIGASAFWNFYQNSKDTLAKAKIEARTIYQHNLAYRKWSTMHGGIYTRITDKNKSNPHFILPLAGDQGGIAFSMIDPFQMTRQAYDVLHKQSPSPAAISRTVSLDYRTSADPYDEPDAWEQQGLTELQNSKVEEVAAVLDINDSAYLRLLKPYIIDQGCLKCHGQTDYKVGEVRGGMSVAVPLEPYYETAVAAKRTIVLTHLFLWILGCLTIFRFSASYKKYRRDLTESEEKFRIVSEFAYNFEYWIREDNSLAFISPSCEQLTGYTREEFLANPRLLIDIIHSDDVEAYRKHVHRVDDPSHEGTDYRVVTKDGQTRWFSHTCSPIYINGEFLGRRGSSVDITEHKRLEEQLHKAKQLEYLGRFAGGIAHDFNNVLGSINTFTHLLYEELREGSDTVLHYIKYIKIASKLGKNMTSNLLSFGKRQIINPQKTSLNKIISNISDILKTLVDEETRYVFKFGKLEYELLADRHQIEQILINLCTNARDAMKKTGGEITISSGACELADPLFGNLEKIPAGRYMTMAVSDTGQGIAPEHMSKICEPFFTTKEASKGTGLGLSIIFNIVKQHNGFIDIISEVGRGTTFIIYLPCTCNLLAASADKEVVVMEPEKTKELETTVVRPTMSVEPEKGDGKMTILLVDDDDLIRKSLRIPLERMGYEVITADDGRRAIATYLDHKRDIDLIILDVVLPQKNGKEVYDVVRRDNPEMKVIFISGYTDNIISEEIIRQEGICFLAKPIDVEVLMESVTTMIGT